MRMERFTKESMQTAKEMAQASNGILMANSMKVIVKIMNGMVSKYKVIKILETQYMPNFKMVSQKDYQQIIYQMVLFGARIQKIKNTALRFFKTMI
jgi:hypothetical protein